VSNEYRTRNYDPGKNFIDLVMSERHNDVIDVITQKSGLNYEMKYDI